MIRQGGLSARIEVVSMMLSLMLVGAHAFCPGGMRTALARDASVARASHVMIFGKSAAQQRAIDEAYEAQQAILARRRNPRAREQYFKDTEKRREQETDKWIDKLAWQKREDSAGFNKLDEFKKRRATGKVKKLGYEDQQKGGIPLPMASFGVGGEFGVGGKFDNGERFDLRLPYVDMGWVEEKPAKKAKGEEKKQAPGGKKPGPFDFLFGKK